MHYSTKIIELGSCAFRQPKATSHCRFLHGYQLTAKFWFVANELDENNWVVDFGSLKELKKLLQQQFDHTTCIARTDPKLDEFKRLEQAGVCDLRVMDGVGIEKFAEWCHGAADNFAGVLTNLRCRCVRVEVFEHENNSAIHEQWPDYFAGDNEYLEKKNNTPNNESNDKPVSTGDLSNPASTSSPKSGSKDVTKPPFSKKTLKDEQNKVVGRWVDPKYSGKTKNTWLF